MGGLGDKRGSNSHDGEVTGSFYSRGKLLITGEYLMLQGADGLALPVQMGQRLDFTKNTDQLLSWTTLVGGERWFEAVFSGSGYRIETASDNGKARFLRQILVNASELSATPRAFGSVESTVGFDMGWGLGSSSSLISNVAFMFDVNPFALHFSVSKGSGYDIACARSDAPVIYRLEYHTGSCRSEEMTAGYPGSFPVPVYRPAMFNPPFGENIFFVYTGKKQNSAKSVEKYLSAKQPGDRNLKRVSRISEEIVNVADIERFNELLKEHDSILSQLLGEVPVNDSIFKGFPGYVKSLGAWGGDFVMITWQDDARKLFSLLGQKGMDIVFPYNKIIYNAK